MKPALQQQLSRILDRLPVRARRLVLHTVCPAVSVPMLRGVWGRAIHGLDREAYHAVFHSQHPSHRPSYVLRPAMLDDEETNPAIDWILIGEGNGWDEILLRAWDVAGGMGLGELPDRQPFFIKRIELGPDGVERTSTAAWPLSAASWPADEPGSAPCRLWFVTPLSLQHNKKLISEPTLTDIAAKAARRLGAFLPDDCRSEWEAIKGELIEVSRDTPATRWHGERLHLKRYSAAQQREFQVPGVCGYLDLPSGPGALWPILAAIQWVHVGKSTNVGLGQLVVEPLNLEPGDGA